MNTWLQTHTLMNLPLYQWAIAALLTLFYFFIFLGLWEIVLNKLKALSAKSLNALDDVIVEVLRTTKKLTLALIALLLGIRILELPIIWGERLNHLTFIVIGIQIAIWVSKGINIWTNAQLTTRDGERPNLVITAMLSWIFKALVWSILLLTILANIGVNITAFVASLGIGGVAIALAVQNILSDLFASLAIGLDKPFVIGDFVVFGNVAGTIERVGLKTTHIRSIDGEQIVCSNMELLKNTIHNYKRMSQRRVIFNFSVSQTTTPDDLEKIPAILKNIIGKIDQTRFDRAHFKSISKTALDFEVVYFIDTDNFNLYMDIQQKINLTLMRELQKEEIDFALPCINPLRMDAQPAT